MSTSDAATLVIGIVVLAWVLYRQLITRRLRENYRASAIFGVIGLIQFGTFLGHHPHGGDGKIVLAVVGSFVIAAVSGAARAFTIRVWRQDDQLLRKGTWLTAVLWIIGLAAHLGWDYLVAGHITATNGSNVGDATILLYLMVTLTIQQYVLLTRVRREEAEGRVPVDPHVQV